MAERMLWRSSSGCWARTFVGAAALLAGIGAPGRAFAQSRNLLVNSTFDSGTSAPWMTGTNSPYATVSSYVETLSSGGVVNTTLNLNVSDYDSSSSNAGAIYDVQVGQPVAVIAGRQYTATFWAMSLPSPGSLLARVKVGGPAPAYYAYLDRLISIPGQVTATQWGQSFSFSFVAPTSEPNAWFGLFLGGATATVKIDSLYLYESTPGAGTGGASGTGGSNGGTGGATGTANAVFTNQVGFVPAAAKRATVVSSATAPLAWLLLDSAGQTAASGTTVVGGLDSDSGDRTHLADFSSAAATGDGFRLQVGARQSQPFVLRNNVYASLRRDALRFFYHQRASTPIAQPYAEGTQWARAAGHPDAAISCLPGTGCSYTLNVSKGWYDAGDHGKYVVNGGIALWTLFNLYERTRYLGTTATELGDGTLNIPEGANGVADLLDEARWEMEFMLGMQVPQGQPLAGMAHHKVHDDSWTAIPMLPASDQTPRHLHPPSTAATLNLAATAAQCARIFRGIDDIFASRCGTAAARAFAAAQANPRVYAPATDGTGGGTYDDNDASDELYWAAAELYVSTGMSSYLDVLRASPLRGQAPAVSWSSTGALGTISLAVVPSLLPAADLAQARQALITSADALLGRAAADAYGSPLGTYGWGSNGDMLNAGMLLALAHDISGDPRYQTGALATLDYVLGRNPLDRSYVTGYGARPFVNAHHRFWAHAFDASFPTPPPGVLAGGANARLEGLSTSDPLVGCAPMKCWRDDAQAYSLAEVTVNWNAPLAWMAAWASEHGTNPPSTHPGVTGMGGAGTGGNGGATDGGGATGGGGADGRTDAGDASGGPGEHSGGGCGCVLAPDPASGTTWLVGILVSLIVIRRRRSKRARAVQI